MMPRKKGEWNHHVFRVFHELGTLMSTADTVLTSLPHDPLKEHLLCPSYR